MFEEKPEYLSTHVLLDAKRYTRDLKDFYFSFLELPKFKKTIDQLETLVDKWAYFFKHASDTTPEELNKLVASHLIFKEVYNALNPCHWTEKELYAYEQQKKQDLDEKAILDDKLTTSKLEIYTLYPHSLLSVKLMEAFFQGLLVD